MEKLQNLMNEIQQWSDDTFDNGEFNKKRSISISHHLLKESKELTEALTETFENKEHVKEEIIDCLTLILDTSAHYGIDASELIDGCYEKLEINKNREWGKPDENGVVEHIRK